MTTKVNFASKRKTITVHVPELEMDFTLRALSNGQLRSINTSDDDLRPARQLAASIIDPETGQRVYTTDDDLANLSEMSMTASEVLFAEFSKLNGLKKPEEIAKKSEASPSTDSVSA